MKWPRKQLEQICSIKTGKLDSNAAMPDGQFPFFTCAQETLAIDEPAFDTEAVLLGGNNAAGIYPLKYYSGEFNAYQRTYVIESLDNQTLSIQYLYYALRPALKYFQNISIGAATQYLTKSILNSFLVRLPPIDVQRSIAEILSAYDELIENNRRRMALLEGAARQLYREWFVRLRFPGHEHTRITNGVPKGWERKPVEELTTFLNRGIAPQYNDDADGLVINQKCIREGRLDLTLARHQSREFKPDRQIQPGDVLVNSTGEGTLGRVARVLAPVANCTADTHVTIVRPITAIGSHYFGHALMEWEPRFSTMGRGATNQTELSRNQIGAAEILVPSQSLVKQFEEFEPDSAEQTAQRCPRPAAATPNERRNRRMTRLTEDTLVQQTTADYLRHALGWETVFAYNGETFGPEGTFGRASDREVVLTRTLGEKIIAFNPGLPEDAYRDAVRQVVEWSAAQSPLSLNQDKYALLKDGVPVSFRNEKGEIVKQRLRLFDFEQPENNHFLAVRELWVRGDLYRRRADIIGFVNGIPLLFMELKNIHKDIRQAYEQNLADYKDTVPHLFHHNAFMVLANGSDARIGSLSGRFEHFHEWKRLEEAAPGAVDMETLLKGVCDKRNFLDLFENFILFDDSSGRTVKIVARNHQFLGVNRAIEAVRDRKAREGKLGVFWHTQGAGKSYSMACFTRKVHRKIGGNYTFLVLTDRDDLDTQIYKTFAGCRLVNHEKDPCRAASGEHLKALLGEHKNYIFSLIQKFGADVDPRDPYSVRDDVIVITDEAHRTQYGRLALNLRNALPNAAYIGFTGTPLFKDDEITRRVFGDYVSTYDFQRAVEDKATVPLYYDARGERLGVATTELNERVSAKLEELEIDDVDVQQRLERELKRDYHIITAEKRLDQIARDLVEHYSTAWETGKAMLVCIDKVTCVRMYELIKKYWSARMLALSKDNQAVTDDQEEIYRHRQIQWMEATRMAVVVSEEQGEVDKFRKWNLDITPHRRLIKEGYSLADGKRIDLDEAFKKEEHPFRIAIVCAMWLTGFDVPSLATLYLDKPLRAHTLMQAIARANRVNAGKNNGLIVDYCGILKNLRKALATFAGSTGPGGRAEAPARPAEELLADLDEAIAMVRGFLVAQGFRLEDIREKTGFARNAAIVAAKEAVNENDETRKRFEIMAREVFKKFKACLTLAGVNDYRHAYDAINIVYKSLQDDRDAADITDIIRALHRVVDEAIVPNAPTKVEARPPYDISKIDFDRLRKEFEHSQAKRTTVQNLKQAVEKRLSRLIARNPLRTDLQRHYEEFVADYNREKDRVTIESTFAALLKFVQALDDEESRAMRESLDEESLALFDLLLKPGLGKPDIQRIKKVAAELLATLKAEKLRIENWREKEATRDAVQVTIENFLWADNTGLPAPAYSEEDVKTKSRDVYRHVHRVYPRIPSPFYTA